MGFFRAGTLIAMMYFCMLGSMTVPAWSIRALTSAAGSEKGDFCNPPKRARTPADPGCGPLGGGPGPGCYTSKFSMTESGED